jgi:hypothetical protein
MKFLLLYVFLFLIYGLTGLQSPGYDDEFFNINLIEQYGFNTLRKTQSGDVHPPLSYLLNLTLHNIFGEWGYVRASIGLFTAASLISGINYIRRQNGDLTGFVAFIVLGLNPAFLLWCTGLRWYAFFVPILIFLLQVPIVRNKFYWAKCFIGLTTLAYIGYAAFLVAPAIVILYWLMDNSNLKKKLKEISIWGGLSILIYAYQLNIFLNIHLQNKDSQISGIFKSILGVLVSNFSNQGVFPLSFAGIATFVGTSGLSVLLLHYQFFLKRKNQYLIPYGIATLIAILSGLAGKFRNLVVISPMQAYWIATSIGHSIYQSKLLKLFLCCIFVGNIWGIVNVMLHQNTTKNSWNIPVKVTLRELELAKADCFGNHLFLVSDPSLTWHIKKAQFDVTSPSGAVADVNKKYNCLTVVKTYAGSLPDFKYKNMYEEIGMVRADNTKIIKIGKDEFFWAKRYLDNRYPEYQVEIITYSGISNLPDLKSWLPENQ